MFRPTHPSGFSLPWQHKGAEPFARNLLAAHGNAEAALAEIAAVGDTFTALRQDFSPMVQHVKNYPWIDELDGLFIAADMENPTSFITHMHTAPHIEMSGDSVLTMHYFTEHLATPSTATNPAPQDVAAVAAALESMRARHAAFEADTSLLYNSSQFCIQAIEHLADLHAVRQMPDPLDATAMASTQIRKGAPKNNVERNHPSWHQRHDSKGSFAMRVLHQRQKSADHTPSH